MKKIKAFVKKNYKVVIGIIIGIAISVGIGVSAVATKDIEYDNTTSGLTSTNLQGAIDEIYEKAKKTEFKVGDYVSMTPTKTSFTIPQTLTGYTSNQTITPNELNLWRVIRINNDKTVDMISEYVSSSNVYFKGSTGYQNYIGTLNYIAKQYENKKYTSGSRCMGYDGTQTEYITDTHAILSTSAPSTYDTEDRDSGELLYYETLGFGDLGYKTDYNLVNTALGTLMANKVETATATSYFLASRHYSIDKSTGGQWVFAGRGISNTEKWILYGSINLYGSLYGDFGEKSGTNAVRPIVTLNSGVKASSGDGSSSSPYVLP